MANVNIFTPGNSVTAALTGTAATTTLPTGAGTYFRFANSSANVAFFAAVTAATAATTGASTPMLGNSVELFTLDPSATGVSFIMATGNTGTVYITRGQGI